VKAIILTLKEAPKMPVEVDAVLPETVAGKSLKEVGEIAVYAGNKKIKLHEYFEIEGETADDTDAQEIHFKGDTLKLIRIGEGMADGVIRVEGNAGDHIGERMKAGRIIVNGNAGGWIGTALAGGEIHIKGNAQNKIGCAERGSRDGMSSGLIVVEGDAGTEIGYEMDGGNIEIYGKVRSFVGSHMKEGVVKVGGVSEDRIGFAMAGGEIYVEDSGFKPPFFFKEAGVEGEYAIFEGDLSTSGEGRIFIRKSTYSTPQGGV